ncbi:MAG: hypothetical protein CMB11_08360 [Euryarchaeota archaeon]|nr:hypothetical protein [Euryarchaeota archaeon]
MVDACDRAVEACHGLLNLLIKRDCIDGVRLMLELGVPFDSCDLEFLDQRFLSIATGMSEADWEMAKLLRKHNAPVFPYQLEYCDSNHAVHKYGQTPHPRNSPAAVPYWKTLLKVQREPFVAYRYVHPFLGWIGDNEGPEHEPKEVLSRWPPREAASRDLLSSLQAIDDAESVRATDDAESVRITPILSSMWDAIARLRRDEAKRLCSYNWWRVRKRVLMRNVAMYWWGETQKRACAPGGTGRKRDRAAYCAAFG